MGSTDNKDLEVKPEMVYLDAAPASEGDQSASDALREEMKKAYTRTRNNPEYFEKHYPKLPKYEPADGSAYWITDKE